MRYASWKHDEYKDSLRWRKVAIIAGILLILGCVVYGHNREQREQSKAIDAKLSAMYHESDENEGRVCLGGKR